MRIILPRPLATKRFLAPLWLLILGTTGWPPRAKCERELYRLVRSLTRRGARRGRSGRLRRGGWRRSGGPRCRGWSGSGGSRGGNWRGGGRCGPRGRCAGGGCERRRRPRRWRCCRRALRVPTHGVHDHDHRAAFEKRHALDYPVVFQAVGDLQQEDPAAIGMRELTATEANGDFELV